MKHVMLDLETMGTASNAAIVALGAVAFDPETKKTGEEFYRTIRLDSSVAMGGVIDPSTVLWWMQQNDAAKREVLRGEYGLRGVLIEFAEYLATFLEPEARIWGNGAAFDNVVLKGAYLRDDTQPPWTHRQDRCFRTIKALFPGFIYAPSEVGGVQHNALDDAREQVGQLFQLPIVVH